MNKLTDEERLALEQRKFMSRALRLIAINAYGAYRNTLVGNVAPAVKRQFARTSNPVVGDTVLEVSTIWKWAKYSDEAPAEQYPGIGVLLRIAAEPCITQEQLDEMHSLGDYFKHAEETLSDVPKETVYYIEPLDGSVPEYRWTNARFIRVLTSLDDYSWL
jgi:hypothetical protein